MSRRRRPDRFTVIKDVVSYIGGWGLILHQALIVPRPDFNLWLLGVGAGLVGAPGVGQLWAMRTAGSPSEPPEEDSS